MKKSYLWSGLGMIAGGILFLLAALLLETPLDSLFCGFLRRQTLRRFGLPRQLVDTVNLFLRHVYSPPVQIQGPPA